MLTQAEKQGYDLEADFDATLLTAEKEVDLLAKLGEFPKTLTDAATRYTPHHVTQYVYDLATHLHSFYNAEKDRKSTRLNSSHVAISYAVFCLKKKKKIIMPKIKSKLTQ